MSKVVWRRGSLMRQLVAAACMVLVACALPASRAAAEEHTRLYNAALSLSGDCTVSEVDLVPDPGCPEIAHPPEGPIVSPRGVTTDSYGDIYLVNTNPSQGNEVFHVDVFDPSGHYITEVTQRGALSVAVDSTGHLYVVAAGERLEEVVRFDPEKYNPSAKEIVYKLSPVVLSNATTINRLDGIALDRSDDHVYFRTEKREPEPHAAIVEYGPAVDEVPNVVLNEFADAVPAAGGLQDGEGELALDSTRHRIYIVDYNKFTGASARDYIEIYSTQPPYQKLGTIDGSTTPAGTFSTELTRLEPAVDEANGHLFVSDGFPRKKIYEFNEEGGYIGTLSKPPTIENEVASIVVDNSSQSPNKGYLFTPSGTGSAGHLYAWEPKPEPKPPVIESLSFDGVTNEQSILHAKINPRTLQTHYVFEYISQAAFEEAGFAAATIVGEGDLAASSEGVSVSAPATGLLPGTAYEFRVLASNECAPGGCMVEAQQAFSTYIPYRQSQGCGNSALRVGASAALPDCRAFELVTPSNTGGMRPYAPESAGGAGSRWGMPTVTADGDNVAFLAEGGVLPGLEGNAAFDGDDYVSRRGESGWRTVGVSPTGPQASSSYGGGFSFDYLFQAVRVAGGAQGSLVTSHEGDVTYIRYPDGSYHLAGQGSLETDFDARVQYIAPGGTRAIVESAIQLEPGAPATGVYERTLDGTLHLASVLPENSTASGEAIYTGASLDASTIAFTVGRETEDILTGTIFLRVGGATTLLAAPEGSESAGLSTDGRYLFYVNGGDLYRFDALTQETARISNTGDVMPLNVSADGTSAYFISPSVLGEGVGPNGASPAEGQENIYYWNGNSVRFVATVTKRDVEGADSEGIAGVNYGLGRWRAVAHKGERNEQTSETNPGGSTLLFESRADLTGYEADGWAEIYRYDAGEGTLICVSCNPSHATPSSDARIRPGGVSKGRMALNPFVYATNVSPDGRRVIFETAEQLVAADTDGVADVYEWEADGKGSCSAEGGCVFLLSSGHSTRPNELFGVSESGGDVFISTSDLLLGVDNDETPSLYDARVEGGFPAPPSSSGECLGEACQPAAQALDDPTAASLTFQGRGNLGPQATKPHAKVARCPKGKVLLKRAGKSRCVKKQKRRKHRQSKGHAGRRAHR